MPYSYILLATDMPSSLTERRERLSRNFLPLLPTCHRAYIVYFLLKDMVHLIPGLEIVKPILGLPLAPNGIAHP